MEENGDDNYEKVSGILNVNVRTEVAIARQGEIGFIKLMPFEMPILGGENLFKSCGYGARMLAMQNFLFCLSLRLDDQQDIIPTTFLNMSYDEAKKMVVEKEWEGLVLYDEDFRSSFRLDGKEPERIEGCWKWKLPHEDDFIVREWVPSEKRPGSVKEIILLQIDPVMRKEFECGRLGNFNQKTRADLLSFKYPIVLQVKFEKRFPKSGKLRNARFIRFRTDKKVSDCIAPRSYTNPD